VVAAVSLPAAVGGCAIWMIWEGVKLLKEAVNEGCFDKLTYSASLLVGGWILQENYDAFPTLLDHFFINRKAPMRSL
jgi:hypothetical protein